METTTNTTAATATAIIQPRAFTPKRGIKPLTLKLINKNVDFKRHHQKDLIIEILEKAKNKEMALAEIIEKVEKDESLWKRLQSKQSVFNCITYHMKDLAKYKVIEVK